MDMVEYEQQPQATPQATPQTLAPPMPPSDPVEETKQQEGVVEYEAPPPPKPPSPPSPPRAAERGKRKEQLEEETTRYEPSPPPPPEISMPVDGNLRRRHVEEEILTAKLICFSFRYPNVADRTLDGDGVERAIRRRRVRRIKGAGARARVVGLVDDVQCRRRRCPRRS